MQSARSYLSVLNARRQSDRLSRPLPRSYGNGFTRRSSRDLISRQCDPFHIICSPNYLPVCASTKAIPIHAIHCEHRRTVPRELNDQRIKSASERLPAGMIMGTPRCKCKKIAAHMDAQTGVKTIGFGKTLGGIS